MNDRQSLRAIDIAMVTLGVIFAVILGGIWSAAMVNSTPPEIVHVDRLVCVDGAEPRSWYGFDASYHLAVCYRDGIAVDREQRPQLTCKAPAVVVIDGPVAECSTN